VSDELETARALARGALAALEASRQRIDDLNVYPVPDGDTGTNLTLTVRAIVEQLETVEPADRAALARELTRAALMGARGNSGVIFSQIVRGAAEVIGDAPVVDVPVVASAVRGAADAAYRAVRRPVEGTMLTVVREMAEAAESARVASIDDLLPLVVRRGEEALDRTPELLDVLREAGVVDAGGAGLVEIVRGIAATLAGEELPATAGATHEDVGFDAIHQELSRYRYCTVFLIEGESLDADALERELERVGDSLLVVGDASTLKVHVHTDDPGFALTLGVRAGTIDRIEIANMHRQTEQREERLLAAVPEPEAARTAVVAVSAGAGNRRLFESLGAQSVVEGGQSMNPAAAELVAAIDAAGGDEVLVLPNNANVLLAAEQAASLASRPARVVHATSIPAGLAAMVAFDPARTSDENAADMDEIVEHLSTGEVTVASRDADLNGLSIRDGQFLGLVDGEPVLAGESFDDVTRAVVERLLGEPRGVLTLLTGQTEPALDGVLAWLGEAHPELEVDVHAGGQPHYPLLLSAE
jgi:DAK2 domain fusion protein YloV